MGLKPFSLLRILLIALIASATGPRPAMAIGDRMVICGAEGQKRTVFFDFETGEPVQELGFELCADCLTFALALLGTPPNDVWQTASGARVAKPRARVISARSPQATHPARAPPVSDLAEFRAI